MSTELHWHPAAEAFPLMDGDAFQAFVDDVRANGLRRPIEVYDGQRWPEYSGCGLDGRNRMAACQAAGVAPRFNYLGDVEVGASLTTYIASANVFRRHLTSSQAAFVAVAIKKQFEVEAKNRQIEGAKKGAALTNGDMSEGRLPQKIAEGESPIVFKKTNANESRQKAAEIVGTNRQYVTDAEFIARESPSLAEQVRAGLLTIPNAKWAIKKKHGLPEAFASLEAGAFSFEQFRMLCSALGDEPMPAQDDQSPPCPAEISEPAQRQPSLREVIKNVRADLPGLQSIIDSIGMIKERIIQAARAWSGAWMDMNAAFGHLDSVCAILRAGAPRALCPTCGGDVPAAPKICPTCESTGFIAEGNFQRLSPELQAQAR
jgi:hypothetical protein